MCLGETREKPSPLDQPIILCLQCGALSVDTPLMRMPMKLLIPLIAALLPFSIFANQPPIPYSGHSDYRLLVVHQQDKEFNPSDDLLIPSNPLSQTTNQQRTLKREQLQKAVFASTLKSLVPLMSLITAQPDVSSPDAKGSDITQLIFTAATIMRQTLLLELEPHIELNYSLFPFVHEIFLIPWNEKRGDLFYGAEKITVEPSKYVNILGTNPKSSEFSKKLTGEIKALQSKFYQSSALPVQLLGLRYRIWIDPFANGEFSRVLKLQVLLGLKPRKEPYVNNTDKMNLYELEIPDLGDRQPVAVLNLDLPLMNAATDPKLKIELGDFQEYSNASGDGEFKLVPTGRNKSTPKLHGYLPHKNLSKVGIDFSFNQMEFNLKTLNLSALDLLVSPGLHLKNANFTIGGFNVESVDKEFQGEINKTLDQQIQNAIKQGKSQLENGLMKLNWIQDTFVKIFGGKK